MVVHKDLKLDKIVLLCNAIYSPTFCSALRSGVVLLLKPRWLWKNMLCNRPGITHILATHHARLPQTTLDYKTTSCCLVKTLFNSRCIQTVPRAEALYLQEERSSPFQRAPAFCLWDKLASPHSCRHSEVLRAIPTSSFPSD